MATELRCPDCGSKLRLKTAPEPGTEIECPKCTFVFTARPQEDDAADEPPAKTPPADDDERPKAAEGEKAKKKKGGDKPKGPKKRRAKKKETNKTVLIFALVGALVFLGSLTTLLVWFFGRTPASYEMLNYLPEDTHSVMGLNVGHCQKYAEFNKQVENAYGDKAFRKAGDAAAKALGMEYVDLVDYMVYGESKNGDVIVLRSKKEFDRAGLAKLPGAKSQQGGAYYTVSDIPGMNGFTGLRVFAPTNRLIVFCPGSIPENVFRNMLKGQADNPDKSMVKRMGPLGKRVVRGTWWGFRLIEGHPPNKPLPPPAQNAATGDGQTFSPGDEGQRSIKQLASDSAGSAKGYGFKVSIGSRTARFEVVIWQKDDEAAKSLITKFRESDLAKSDDASIDPPRWWKTFMQGMGDRKIANEMFTSVGAKTSGDVFIIYTEIDTKLVMTGISSMVGKGTTPNSLPEPPGGHPQTNTGAPPGGGPRGGP